MVVNIVAAGRPRPGHGGDRGRPARVRAPPRPHPPRLGRAHGLRLGGQGRRRRRLPGADAEGVLHFPGFGAEATGWLLRRRGIRALGVDTLSIDPGVSETFDTHLILLGADRYGVENLNNLDRIPRRGATIMVGLIPYEQGSGGQARVFASW